MTKPTDKTTRTSSRKPKSYNKKKGKSFKKDEYRDVQDNQSNDPAWYSTSPELLRDSASIPFSWPTGTAIHEGFQNDIQNDRVPGLISMGLYPTIGYSDAWNSPVNVAANAVYSFVRHANSGHSNYDASDLMMYLIAISNVYSFITWCQRLLGFIDVFDQRNRYLPRAIFSANVCDYDDFLLNRPSFRYWLNTYITKVASFAVPATMPYFQRLAFLYANVYSDGPSVKDQFYEYHPTQLGWYKFSLDGDSKGQLTFTGMTGSGLTRTVSDVMSYGEDLFNAIWQQEDFGIMSGDILKAYGDNIIKLSTVAADFRLQPIYDAMFLHQFKNAKLCSKIDYTTTTITQAADGHISQTLNITGVGSPSWHFVQCKKILSTDFDQPTPEVVIESTRLMPGFDSAGSYLFSGTEIPVTVAMLWYDWTNSLQKTTCYFEDWSLPTNPTQVDVNNVLLRLAWLRNFKYAPEVMQYFVGEGGVIADYGLRHWDIDNYAVLDGNDLEKLHQTALMSMFAVPAIAKIS